MIEISILTLSGLYIFKSNSNLKEDLLKGSWYMNEKIYNGYIPDQGILSLVRDGFILMNKTTLNFRNSIIHLNNDYKYIFKD